MVFARLLEGGGDVLVPTPHYPCYPNFIRFCGGEPVFVETHAVDGFRVRPEALARARTARTRAVVLGSPANPTGAISTRETLEAVAALGLPIVADEIYDGLVYDGQSVHSALSVADDAEVYALDGFSKRYAMTGFRLGWVVAPDAALRSLQIMQQNLFISASRFVQHAGVAALAAGEPDVADRRARYQVRRDRLVAGLRELGFEIAVPPSGAFYVLADARRFGSDSRALAFDLLERAGVGVTPGVDFGAAGEGYLRFCFAVPEATLEAALQRLAEALLGRSGSHSGAIAVGAPSHDGSPTS
jgi:aspartate/methionine/tyrosine aminotransferase